MKLKLLSAAATTTIAALISMPGQQAYADECVVVHGFGTQSQNGAETNVSDPNDEALACGEDAQAMRSSVAIGSFASAAWDPSTDPLSQLQAVVDDLRTIESSVHLAIEDDGAPAMATEPGAIALGANAQATNDGAVAIGQGSEASGSTAVGQFSKAVAPDAAAYGKMAEARGTNSSAIGENSRALGENSTTLGAYAQATANNSTAIGSGAQATFENSAAFGAGVQALAANQFMFGQASNTYAMPGLVTQASRDAQSGNLELVTVDANGNLASDGGALIGSLQAGFSDSVSGLQSKVSENETEITTLQVGVSANTTAIEANTLALSTAQVSLTASEKEIAHNASQIEVNTADIALLNAGVTGDGGRFIELENEVVDQGNRMNVVETGLANNTTALSTLSGTVNANQQRIAHSEQSIADNAQAISLMQTDFERLEFNVNSVALQLARTREEIEENTAGIAISNALSGSTWLQSNEQIAFSANLGYYDGSSAVAFSGAARISQHISANLAIGLVPSRGDIGARAGVRVGW